MVFQDAVVDGVNSLFGAICVLGVIPEVWGVDKGERGREGG